VPGGKHMDDLPTAPEGAADRPRRIGIIEMGGEGWIAGLLYLQTAIRALNLLPDDERPELHLLAGPRSSGGVDSEVRIEARHAFGYRRAMPFTRRVGAIGMTLAHRRRPLSLERMVSEHHVDVVWPAQGTLGPAFPVPWAAWVPDFQHKQLPEFFDAAARRERDRRFSDIARDAPQVVVSSCDARRDLLRWFPVVEPDRVSVLPFATIPSPDWYTPDPGQTAAKFQLPEKYLIFPSQFWVHKNHALLFEAVRLLRDGGLGDVCLVCTGFTGDDRDPEHFARLEAWLQRHELSGNVRILGLLPRPQQIQLVRAAAAVVQPSLFEGWSMLVEDARTLGKRIYLSDLAVHHEQQPDDAVFFPRHEPEALAEAIAADWPGLRAGPDLQKERAAREGNALRGLAFARDILAVLERTQRRA
jgi:glycosyltransferase involved in cell wall biosynthesis